jgi:GGDEF domain-containing protein/tetratricopeptide (TPR) repeat protein
MDRSEISKRIERAEKLLQKGKTAEALNDYLEVLNVDPGNDSICQMAADLSLSLQRIPEAVKLLGRLFERQIESGDATRASLTYKKLARYANPSWEQKLRFGGLLENTNRKLATETYETVFDELTKAGRKQESHAVLQKILNLDPGEKNLLRFAELSSALGAGKESAAAFLKLAGLTRASGGNATQWIERAYAEDPSDSEIALAYSQGLLGQQQIGAAIFVLEPLVNGGTVSREMRETYAKALLAADRLLDAEPVLWQLFEENPSQTHEIAALIGRLLTAGQDTDAVSLAKKLEQYQQRKGERRSFLSLMQRIMAEHQGSIEMLEFMSEQFNAANRETEYCQTLLKLFDLSCEKANHEKAAEFLDRALDVDIYEHGHQKRLEMLRGKIDDKHFKMIASRLSSVGETAATPVRSDEKLLGAAALQDLMLQAEILVQYGMRSKAIERLQRIQQVFPHEEERNPALQQLYLAAGMVPTYAPVAEPAPPSRPPVAPPVPKAVPPAAAEMSNLTRVAEITRKLYRQSNADAVMTTAVNEIGAHWKAARCVIAMRKPGLSFTSIKEYSLSGQPAESGALGRVVLSIHDLAIAQNSTLQVPNVYAFPDLQGQRDSLSQLGTAALLALPLIDGTEHIGVLLLMQTEQFTWNPDDVVVLKTICDQIVIALNNAGLRRLVKSLSVTDEHSGLMKRASYFDLLMAETRRNLQQATLVSVLLIQFGEKTAMLKEFGEPAIEKFMQEVGRLFSANIRQNDLAFRYEATTVAIVLGETSEKEGLLAAEKLRKLSSGVHPNDKQEALPFAAGLAEAVMRAEYDPVDIVTEVANRAEEALRSAIAHGWGKIVALPASRVSAAVA